MLGDLQNPRLIHLKGWLFLIIGLVSGGLIVAQMPDWRVAALLAICIWGFCRFYYYLFYVIEKYIDPDYKFAGLWSALQYLARRRRMR
jgi:hypothetical protein